MDKLNFLLYIPLTGLTLLWVFAGVKVVQDWLKNSRQNLLSLIGAEVALALFLIGFAIMIATHGHSFKIAMLFVVGMGLVNLLRSQAFLTPKSDAKIPW